METLHICSPDRLQSREEGKGCVKRRTDFHFKTIKEGFKAATVLQNVCDARARELEAEVDPEGPDHNKRPRDPQHSPRRHLIHQLGDFKHLKQMEINWRAAIITVPRFKEGVRHKRGLVNNEYTCSTRDTQMKNTMNPSNTHQRSLT